MPSATLLSGNGHDRPPLLPPALEDRLIGSLGRGTGLLISIALAALWTSLVTWSIGDQSLTHATDAPVRNALGAPGAIVSDLLLQTLGLAAALALFPLMVWGIELLWTRQIAGLRNKATYYPLALLGFAGAASALPTSAAWPIAHGYGGILGDVIYEQLSGVLRMVSADLAPLAAAVILLGLGVMCLMRATGLTRRDILPARRNRPAVPEPLYPAQGSTPHFAEPRYAQAHYPPPPYSQAEHAEPRISARRRRLNLGSLATALRAIKPAWPAEVAPHLRHHTAEPVLPGMFASRPVPAAGAPHAYQPDAYQAESYAALPHAAPVMDHFPADHDTHAAEQGLEDDFAPEVHEDPSLARSSRAIAERFAPANAPRPAPRVEPATAAVHPPHDFGDQDDLPRFMRTASPREPAVVGPPLPPLPTARQPTPARAAPAARPAKPSIVRAIARRAEPVFKRPAPAMLKRSPASKQASELSQTVLRGTARLLEDVLADFGVKGEVRDIKPGPVVTLFELEPARGTKATRIMALADDIARSMSATSARVAVIPGRNVIGIELPNARREMVGLRELFESPHFSQGEGVLPLALGRSIGGEPIIADLARMPHLLVAGTTGSGKSVGVNAMILSILFRHSPEQCRFLMIDPKMLELSVYNGIPHLLTPVVTDPQKAVGALNWVVAEMEERYKRMAKLSVRNIEAFNGRIKSALARGEQLSRTVQTGFDAATGQPIYEREEMDLSPMAYIVVVVDEFADLMITAGKDIETAVQRLAQKARAAGIHLIMATQRPSVDIITGTIKANFPTRISFKVASKIDSRTILNEQGAEQLLGQGDMLYTSGAGQMLRVHGPFVSDEEVEAVAAHLRREGEPRYIEAIADAQGKTNAAVAAADGEDGAESLYDRAVAVVLRDRKASTSYIQRRLAIGYNRAADLIERMEQEGLISAPNHTGRREILAGDTPGRSVA